MDPRERETGRHFLIRPQDLERIRALKGRPWYEKRFEAETAKADEWVENPMEKWEGDDTKIQWSHYERHSGIVNLVLLYLLTGEEKYAGAAYRDVMTLIEISEGNYHRYISDDTIQETHINRSILFAHEWITELFSDEERERIRDACIHCIKHHVFQMARWTAQNKTVQNHLLQDATGVVMVALYFNDFKLAQEWADLGIELAVGYMRDAFNPDGAQNELTPSYHTVCILIGLLLSQVLRDFGNRDLMKEPWFRGVMERAVEWPASLITPSGTFVPFNDSHENLPPWLFRFGASEFNNPHFQAAADFIGSFPAEGREFFLYDLLFYDPSIPSKWNPKACRVFPDSTTAALRTGFGPKHSMLAQKAGFYKGNHAHHDRLGFEYWHQGQRLLLDIGQMNIGYYKGTSIHNVVGIAEKQENPIDLFHMETGSVFLEHRNHLKNIGKLHDSRENEEFGFISSEASIYENVGQKRILVWLKKSGILIVYDSIKSKKPFTFDQLFHGKGKVGTGSSEFVFFDSLMSLAGSVLFPADAEILILSQPEEALGPRDYIAVRKEGSNVNFLTVLEPFTDKQPSIRGLDPQGKLRIETDDGLLECVYKDGSLRVTLGDKEVL